MKKAIIFDRLYVVSNQLIHGVAAWNSKVNRDQVRDGANILEKLVPTIIFLMLEMMYGVMLHSLSFNKKK